MLGAIGDQVSSSALGLRVDLSQIPSQALNALFWQGSVRGHKAALCPSRTGELAVQAVSVGSAPSWTPVATGPSDTNPRWYLFSLENVLWKTLLREFRRAARASSAQSFGTRTAQSERRPAPPPHRLRLLEQLSLGFGSG